MPPKKRDKDDGTKNIINNNRDVNFSVEHELFLQAFEKPTQIYRYLRDRNQILPIFLHRNLTYMRHRMSRSHKNRAEFKIDKMLSNKIEKVRQDRNFGMGNYMTLIFLGFFDKTLCAEYAIINSTVRVEAVLLKISHKKRKDTAAPYIQESFGSVEVIINPNEDIDEKISAISIPTDVFISANGLSYNQSFILLLTIETVPKLNEILSISDDADGNEPCLKRPKLETNAKLYSTELIIFDKHSRCLISEGFYDLSLTEVLKTTSKFTSPKKHTTWEIIPTGVCAELAKKIDNRVELFRKSPILKFYLKWTNESHNGHVDKFSLVPRILPSNVQQNLLATSTTVPTTPSTATSGAAATSTPITVGVYGDSEKLVANGNIKSENNFIKNNSNNNYTIALPNISNGSSTSLIKPNDKKPLTVYQFIYNNNSRQQTQPCDDMHCPWCQLDCVTLYSLLKHLKLCHDRFIFTYVPIESGARIDVAINDMFDGSYAGSPYDLINTNGCAFGRGGPKRRSVVTNLLVCRPRRLKPSLSEFVELDENELNNQRPYITGHNRLYHHTETCLAVQAQELDIDSEGESDPLWLQHKTMQMIDEFTDVNEGEKELMKMWNLHVMKHGYVGDCQLPIACDMFLDMKGRELLQKNLYRNFVLHMCSLFDYGLVSAEVVYKTIQKLQNILSTYPEGRKIIAESRETQLDYWLKVGIKKQAQQEELKLKQPKEQQQLKRQTKQEVKQKEQNDKKLSISSGRSLTPTIDSKTDKNKSNLKSLSSSSKILNGSSGGNSNGLQQSASSILSRKRNNESLVGKRSYSQMRESPMNRRNLNSTTKTTSPELQAQQKQIKIYPPRRKSIACFNHTDIIKNNSLFLQPSSSVSNSTQSSMRKRVATLAKVDKY